MIFNLISYTFAFFYSFVLFYSFSVITERNKKLFSWNYSFNFFSSQNYSTPYRFLNFNLMNSKNTLSESFATSLLLLWSRILPDLVNVRVSLPNSRTPSTYYFFFFTVKNLQKHCKTLYLKAAFHPKTGNSGINCAW